uniref:tRNA (Cytosine-5-)-methyltransferase n=1 Tax=Ascaris suum TaxID=6253 RepID=F1L8J8_ASCSU
MFDVALTQPAALRCLELFSGIGGFHYALKESGTRFEMLAAFDINDVANAIYKHNFPCTTVHQCNIQALTSEFYDRQCADLWTMSPPCQPFTKKGMQRDVDDRRCDALMRICTALERMHEPPRFIFLENVCGFETSTAHSIFVEVLAKLHYHMQVRNLYYLQWIWVFQIRDLVITSLLNVNSIPQWSMLHQVLY